MHLNDVQEIQGVILALHGCEAEHVDSVHVHEVFEGKTAWDGMVEVFNVTGHPKAKRAYGWQYSQGDRTFSVAVLEIPPVNSAESAVSTVIAAKARQQKEPYGE